MLVLQQVVGQAIPVINVEVTMDVNVGPKISLLSMVPGRIENTNWKCRRKTAKE
jgi:hypothetical protein